MGRPHRRGLGLHPFIPPTGDGSRFPTEEDQESTRIAYLEGQSRPRALVLRGHDGPGALASQMLVRDGWSVWAQVPVPFALPGPALEVSGELRDEEEEKELECRRAVLRRIEERLREWGVDEVLFLSITSSRSSAWSGESLPDVEASPSPHSGSSPSVHIPRSPSSSSQSASASPFSMSSRSSPPSSPYSHMHSASSSGGHPNAFPFLPPYSYTPLPLPPYDTERDSIIALLDYLSRSRVRMDAILDTVGGRGVWVAGQALLARPVGSEDGDGDVVRRGVEAQFTTLVGDTPERVFASAGDNFKAGFRALRIGTSKKEKVVMMDHRDTDVDDVRCLSLENVNATERFSVLASSRPTSLDHRDLDHKDESGSESEGIKIDLDAKTTEGKMKGGSKFKSLSLSMSMSLPTPTLMSTSTPTSTPTLTSTSNPMHTSTPKPKPKTKSKPKSKTKKRNNNRSRPRAVNYAWVNVISDVDWEGDGIRDTLGAVLRLALDHGIRPTVGGPVDFPSRFVSSSFVGGNGGNKGSGVGTGAGTGTGTGVRTRVAARDKGKRKALSVGGENIDDDVKGRIIPFENTPGVFVPGGPLEYGGTVVSRIAG